MNRSISLALAVVFCVSAVSAQAAGPKGKVAIHKPVGVVKTNGTNAGINQGIGIITHPIVNTPPKTAPGFPYNPNGLQMGHGPVVLNPPHHGPINGLPVFPSKPQPTCGWHKCCDHGHYCHDRMPMVSMSCMDNSSCLSLDDSSAEQSTDQSTESTDQSIDQPTDQPTDQTPDQSPDTDE